MLWLLINYSSSFYFDVMRISVHVLRIKMIVELNENQWVFYASRFMVMSREAKEEVPCDDRM